MIEKNEPIESGTEFIESPEMLNLDLDKINLVSVNSVRKETRKNINVHDLKVENLHNYQVKNLGIVHNGGGI